MHVKLIPQKQLVMPIIFTAALTNSGDFYAPLHKAKLLNLVQQLHTKLPGSSEVTKKSIKHEKYVYNNTMT